MKTFFMIKPDGVQRELTNEIIKIIEDNGFTITNKKEMNIVII